jgi:hypothetical protein
LELRGCSLKGFLKLYFVKSEGLTKKRSCISFSKKNITLFERVDAEAYDDFDTFVMKVMMYCYLGHLGKLARLAFSIFAIHGARVFHDEILGVGFFATSIYRRVRWVLYFLSHCRFSTS